MKSFRSMSVREGRMQIDINETHSGGGEKHPPENMHGLRSYSTTSYSTIPVHEATSNNSVNQKEVKIKKSKSKSASSKNWSLSDPELQRKKRVASYKVYAAEGKMKGSVRKSFRWIKDTCSHAVYGWW